MRANQGPVESLYKVREKAYKCSTSGLPIMTSEEPPTQQQQQPRRKWVESTLRRFRGHSRLTFTRKDEGINNEKAKTDDDDGALAEIMIVWQPKSESSPWLGDQKAALLVALERREKEVYCCEEKAPQSTIAICQFVQCQWK